jgi:hypothetical protein
VSNQMVEHQMTLARATQIVAHTQPTERRLSDQRDAHAHIYVFHIESLCVLLFEECHTKNSSELGVGAMILP